MVDLHMHAAPSMLPRHGSDPETIASQRALGFETLVIKGHEGSTVDRAVLAGDNVFGGVVLNGSIGGANPDAVAVAARLGGRVVWMPTVSSANHKRGSSNSELSVLKSVEMRQVDVTLDGNLRSEWYDVFDLVAEHDMLLASGHMSVDEAVVVFRAARQRGVRRLLVNHPKMAFMGWNDEARDAFRSMDATLELGILPDLAGPPGEESLTLVGDYPTELLAFGGDLGHVAFPTPEVAVPPWLIDLERRAGVDAALTIMSTNGRQLLTS
jgi:hypothetical protein